MKIPNCKGGTFVSAFLLGLAANTNAQQLYWDPGATSVWDLTTDNWSQVATAGGPFVVWDNTGASEAVFSFGANVAIADGGVTAGDITIADTGLVVSLQAVTDDDGILVVKPGGATWTLGGSELEFVANQANDTRVQVAAGDTLTIAGEGTFDTGERPAGADWVVTGATLDVTGPAIVRGHRGSVGTFGTVKLADGSLFVHERNNSQTYDNNWELGTGIAGFTNRWDRQFLLTGVISGPGALRVLGLGGQFLRPTNPGNTFTGGVIVDSTANRSELLIIGDEAVLGAVPAAFDPDNITLVGNGELKLNGVTLNPLRGITLDNGGAIINSGNANTYGGTITGTGPLQIGRVQGGDANSLLITSDTHDYTGGTLIAQGRLTLGIDEALPADEMSIGGSGTCELVLNGFTQTFTGLLNPSGNTRRIVNDSTATAPGEPATAGTLILDIADVAEVEEEYSFNSAIGFEPTTSQANLNVVKNGEGAISLGALRIDGNVEVNAGTLRLGNSTATTDAGAVTVASGATLTIDEQATFASLTAASGSSTTFNWEVSDWAGAAEMGFTQLNVGDLTIDSAVTNFTIMVEEVGLTGFTESNATFVVAEVTGSSSLSILDIDVDATGFTSGAGTWAVGLDGNNIVLNYTAGASDPYTAWAAGFPALSGGFDADDDGDGVANGLEYYFFNSDPTVAASLGSPLAVEGSAGAGDLVFSHQRPIDGSGVTATYEWSTTLNGDWTPSGTANGGLTVTITPGTPTPAAAGYENVTVTTTSVPAAVGKLFVRVSLTMP